MPIAISLYDCVINGILECEYVYSWNMYGDELCDHWCVGGATGIGPLTEQGHSTRGTRRWLPTLSIIMLISWNEFIMKDQLMCYSECQTIMECLNEYYEGSIIVL
jgi:hypothetical protein